MSRRVSGRVSGRVRGFGGVGASGPGVCRGVLRVPNPWLLAGKPRPPASLPPLAPGPPLATSHPQPPYPSAGTTSQALIKEQPWIQKHLSTIASAIAILVGALMLLAGAGFDVPFFS